MDDDTIVACATASGKAGVGIIRVSGSLVKSIAKSVVGDLPKPRYAAYRDFRDAQKQLIDRGLVLYFSCPHSFTGEDVLELHAHGGPVILTCLLEYIQSLGARLARPGEFSFRAFQQGKLDLAQAEAIADLIDASSRQAAVAAVRSLQGVFSDKVTDLLESLIALRAYVEAAIDFPEEDIDFLSRGHVIEKTEALIVGVTDLLAGAQQGALLREGVNIVIAGPVNAGKSSLLNALSQQDIAIVTDIPGTTRDVLRQSVTFDGLEGLPLHFVDTAGLRETDDQVELVGIGRAWNEIRQADCVLLVVDTTAIHSEKSVKELIQQLREQAPRIANLIVVKNKIDLFAQLSSIPAIELADGIPSVNLSVKTGEGMDILGQTIKQVVGYEGGQREGGFIARERHISALRCTLRYLKEGCAQLKERRAGELFAEDLLQAQNALAEITGAFTPDDLLGKIFSQFCIGK